MVTTPPSSDSSSNALAHTTRPLASTIVDDEDEPPGSSGLPPPTNLTLHSKESLSQHQRRRSTSAQANSDELPLGGDEKHLPITATVQSEAPLVQARPRRPRLARLRNLFVPAHPIGPAPGYLASLRATLMYTPLNILLLFIPVTWALHYTHQSDTVVFIFAALAIVPLAALLGLGTEQIALRTSHSVGGLLNATLGNIVEMIIAGIALKECDLALVQSSLLGGLLSNLLLVLGTCFLVGGFRFHHQEFQPMAAQLNSSLMTVSVISLLVPAAFHEYLGDRLKGDEGPLLLQLSRGSALVLIAIYFAYLVFQFYSHHDIFMDMSHLRDIDSCRSSIRSTLAPTEEPPVLPIADPAVVSPYETPKLNAPTAIGILVASTALAYLTAEHLVASLNGLVEHSSVSKEWVTLIIIPIISNAAEHTTAVVVAHKGKFDLAMSVAVGSCIQIALFVIPVLILIAWGMGKPLTLLFDPIETMCLFLSVLIVKFSIEDGKSHWMSGVALISVYILIAISFWDYPSAESLTSSALICTH